MLQCRLQATLGCPQLMPARQRDGCPKAHGGSSPFISTQFFPHTQHPITTSLSFPTGRRPWFIPAANREICPGLTVHSFDTSPRWIRLETASSCVIILRHCCCRVSTSFAAADRRLPTDSTLSMVRSIPHHVASVIWRRVSRSTRFLSPCLMLSAHSAVADEVQIRDCTRV